VKRSAEDRRGASIGRGDARPAKGQIAALYPRKTHQKTKPRKRRDLTGRILIRDSLLGRLTEGVQNIVSHREGQKSKSMVGLGLPVSAKPGLPKGVMWGVVSRKKKGDGLAVLKPGFLIVTG